MPRRHRPVIVAVIAAVLLASCAAAPGPAPPSRHFDAAGVTRVVLRAGMADAATIGRAATDNRVTVTGVPTGGAAGYHSADPDWHETPAAAWGLDFVARRFGPVLVISTRNEIVYIHHHYTLDQIELSLPRAVELVRQNRRLSGDGAPDLSPP